APFERKVDVDLPPNGQELLVDGNGRLQIVRIPLMVASRRVLQGSGGESPGDVVLLGVIWRNDDLHGRPGFGGQALERDLVEDGLHRRLPVEVEQERGDV